MKQNRRKYQEGQGAFQTATAVLAELKGRGIKISQDKLYRDIRAGKLPRQETGGFLGDDVETYASMLLAKHAKGQPGTLSDDIAELTREKLKADIEKSRSQKKTIDFDRHVKEGKYCLTANIYRMLSTRASLMGNAIEASFRARVLDYMRMSPDDAVEAFVEDLRTVLHEYSRPPEYEIEYVPDILGRDATGFDDDA